MRANKSLPVALLFAAGIAYRTVIGLQGVDGIDTGFCNTFYQVIFSAPDSNTFNFIYYLTGVLGGAWEATFGDLGLIGFRAFETITLTSAIMFMYLTFRSRMPHGYSAAAIAMSFLFPIIVVTFHYDTLSYLLIAAAVYCISRSEEYGHTAWLTAAGAALGFSFFARIVNLSMLAIPLTMLLYHCLTADVKTGVKKAAGMGAGIVMGVMLVIVLMACLGHSGHYMAALDEAFDTLGREDATHSGGSMIYRYLKSYINVIAQIAAVTALWLTWERSGRMAKKNAVRALVATIMAVLSFTSLPYLSLLAVCTAICLYTIWRDGIEKRGNGLLVYIIVAAYLFPLGSDIGIQGVFNWYAGLMVFPAAWCTQRLQSRTFIIYAYICIAMSAVIKTSHRAYGDTKDRTHSTVMIQPGRLNIYTDKDKAERLRGIIEAVETHSQGNKLLLIGWQQSELYYATKTRPFLGHVQTVIYTGERLKWRLNERFRHFGLSPIILLRKEDEGEQTYSIIKEWMSRKDYNQVYDDGYVQMYVSHTK